MERFLIWIQNKLLNYPDISMSTVQIFIEKFYKCLSNKEKERYFLHIQIIKNITLKQISLDSFVSNHNIYNLENDLNNLKKDDNNEKQI